MNQDREPAADAAPADRHPAGFADALWAATKDLHVRAERTGVVRALLRGQATRPAYLLYLRNLLPAYETLERGLAEAADDPALGDLANPAVYRALAIRSDLEALAGAGWAAALPVLPSAAAYADRIAAAGAAFLVPHAYVRYLGDLNGGQILKRVIGGALGLGAGEGAVYDFPAIDDLSAFARRYRSAFDAAGAFVGAWPPLLDEAAAAFRMNIALSEAVERAAA